ncbi:MAG TPA: amino acid permease [Candidatus Baltobacteraceae bacterium]|jgi:amino acid transporter|nr:amino acid permease [Candidatus Baltobacteraceae bacterium]
MIRALGLRGAIAVNVITMIGIGPLVTIPLVLAALPGREALVGWIVGALIALCDGLVWAELGSLFPGSGGTYGFLRETFGSRRAGGALGFLFAWQTLVAAPLLLASGYIGFAHYAAYLWPALSGDLAQGLTAALVGILTIVLLHRSILPLGRISLAFGIVAVVTLLAVIAAAFGHPQPTATAHALAPVSPAGTSAGAFLAGLGSALVITLYDYFGYGQACVVGDEVRDPAKTLPRSTLLAILLVAALYIALQIGVLGAIDWRTLVPAHPGDAMPAGADYVASTVVARSWGAPVAILVTLAILITAFASTFGNLLGFSRIPYAAARDGLFPRIFARLHSDGFPAVSLHVIGWLAIPACFLTLSQVIAALTTGLVIVQSLAQIAALVALRQRGVRAPARVWLYPFPVLVAAVGWIAIFASAGTFAILFGIGSIAIGIILYLLHAKHFALWPFAKDATPKAAMLAFIGVLTCVTGIHTTNAASNLDYHHSAVVQTGGFPEFTVDGKPFFVNGAAFFYERLPRSQWDDDLARLKALGVNTLDLYVIWNWHELSDGAFDFDGHTSPRRDLHTLMRLIQKYGFHVILRPGPVIRNEWRNAGYPAWLLTRPEYGMPEHELLEGRYPPTATFQNTNSDDAAAEWFANATHRTYVPRWIQRVLEEFAPISDRVLAVALDDDQGAYLNNQTWPAPHLQEYLRWLSDLVHQSTGPSLPVFINTYQMKVTASSPVWAWGNWYQSEAYSIGEHDRTQLEFSTGLLQTQPHVPVMQSEFQAGWLEQAEDIRPRPTDPQNTLLALGTLLAMGAHGVVEFPDQDSLYPAGWEVPFANAFYAWDAALALNGTPNPRMQPVRRFGELIAGDGAALAQTHVVADASIAYFTSAFDPNHMRDNPSASATIAARTIDLQRACRLAARTCTLVDLRFADDPTLARTRMLLLPLPDKEAFARLGKIDPDILIKLRHFIENGGKIIVFGKTSIGLSAEYHAPDNIDLTRVFGRILTPNTLFDAGRQTPIATLGDDRTGLPAFAVIVNYETRPIHIADPELTTAAGIRKLAPIDVAARDVRVVPLNQATQTRLDDASTLPLAPASHPSKPLDLLPIRSGNPNASDPLDRTIVLRAPSLASIGHIPSNRANARFLDVTEDGSPSVILQNDTVRVLIAPNAGARAFVFEDLARGTNVFTTIGALRDDFAVVPPPSPSDRIAMYTHQFPAGTFNRPYRARIISDGPAAIAEFQYDAPDALPAGATFLRTLRLEPHARSFSMDERVHFSGTLNSVPDQRAVSVTSLAVGVTHTVGSKHVILSGGDGVPRAQAFEAKWTIEFKLGNAVGFYDDTSGELATIAWKDGDIEGTQILERDNSVVIRSTQVPERVVHLVYASSVVTSLVEACAEVRNVAAQAQGAPSSNSK